MYLEISNLPDTSSQLSFGEEIGVGHGVGLGHESASVTGSALILALARALFSISF